MRHLILALVGSCGLAASIAPLALARDGDRDTAFGGSGAFLTTQVPGASTANDIAVQPDGKLVVEVAYGPAGVIAVERLNPDGTLDATFGTGGVTLAPASGGGAPGQGRIAIAPDGRIVAADQAPDGYGGFGVGVLRLTPDGRLDTVFGTKGFEVQQLGSTYSGTTPRTVLGGLMVQPDGAIVLTGNTTAPGSPAYQTFFAQRLQAANGIPDPSFGNHGSIGFETGANVLPSSSGAGVVQQPGGSLVFATALQNQFALIRVDASGLRDWGFGAGGVAVAQPSELGHASSPVRLVQTPNGRLIVAGNAYDGDDDQVLGAARFTADGQLDPSFGWTYGFHRGGGIFLSQSYGSAATLLGLAVQPNGKLLLAGRAAPSPSGGGALLVRLTTAGDPDPLFGINGGIMHSPVATAGRDNAATSVVSDGARLAISGYATNPDGGFVARYQSQPGPVPSITAPEVATVGQRIDLTAGATDAESTITGYAWDLDGDGAFADASGSGASTTFTTAGPHVVSVRVTDDNGQTATARVTITVPAAVSTTSDPGPQNPPPSDAGSPPGATSTSVPGSRPPFSGSFARAGKLTVDRQGNITVTVVCPATARGACTDRLTVQTTAGGTAPGATGAARHPKTKTITMAVGAPIVAAGRTVKVKLRLSSAAQQLVRTKHVIHATITVASHDTGGATHTTKAPLTIQRPAVVRHH